MNDRPSHNGIYFTSGDRPAAGEPQTAEAIPASSVNHFRGRYWKPGRPVSRWRYIPDTAEARATAIRAGAMFFTWCSFSFEPVPGGEEPTRYGDLPLDFDCKEKPENALLNLRLLCCSYLPVKHGISPWDLRFFISGLKGFHAEIPACFLGTEAGRPDLPLVYLKIVEKWKAELDLKTLDTGIYSMKRGRMWRLPGIRRSDTGRYKTPLSRDDVAFCSIDELIKLSEAPPHA
jgi:hypothetical protein